MGKRTRKCECGHTWNEHDALTDGFGRVFITCFHVVKVYDGKHDTLTVCACKQYNKAAEVSVPSTS